MAPKATSDTSPVQGSARSRQGGVPMHHPSEATLHAPESEDTPLLKSHASPGLDGDNDKVADPTATFVDIINQHLTWYKRPSVLWLVPIFGLTALSNGMLFSSIGQFQAALLCREYLSHNGGDTTAMLYAQDSGVFNPFTIAGASMRPSEECQAPEIQAYTAKMLAFIEVIGGIASTLTIGYYSSLSDKHGRKPIIAITLVNSFLVLCTLFVLGHYWDQVGLPLMIAGGLVNGLLGGNIMGSTMCLAYAADCTDPSRRSLVFSRLHAGLFLGLAVGPFMGGTIVRATGTIMTIVYIDMVCSLIALFFCLFVVPESLPAKQPAFIRRLYESALGHRAEDGSHDHGNKHNAAVGSWYSHATRSLSFFKPNGRNTNLILLGIISFLQMLAFRGTMSVIILYTNQMFNWTEYEDGIMFSSSSIARLVTLMVVLPILVHYYQKYTKRDNSLRRIRSESSAGKQPDYESKSRPDFGTTSDKSLTNPGSSSDPQLYTGSDAGNQMVFNPNDPSIAASIQHLGESALDFSSDEDSDIASGPVSWQTPKRGDSQSTLPVLLSGERHRHESIDSITTLGPNSGLEGSSSSKGQRPEAESSHPTLKRSASTAAFRSKEQAYNDIKFDTWMVRLGFSINSITYVGYALATEGWLFILAAVLHAVCIIASPSMKSLLMSVVEPTQFGAVLGAIQIVESVAAIVSPIVISGSYALTVKTMPEFVWYSCAGWTGICVILSFMIRQKQFRSNMPGV